MPTIFRQDGFEVMIYTADHEPTHVHCKYAGGVVVINLNDARIAPSVRDSRGVKSQTKRKALEIAATNKDFFAAEWRRIHG